MNIYDIAKEAGVSIATVSRVISGSEKVSESTREKVLSVIDNLGYVPNAFAQGLGLGSMKLIGILCTDVSDIFYAAAVSNLEHLLSQHGLNALLYCTGDEQVEKHKGMDILLSKKVDAIILIGSSFAGKGDNSKIVSAAKQCPIFCVNGYIEDENIYCVLCDEEQAMYENAINLLNSGCKDIAYFFDRTTMSGENKLSGLRRALIERQGEVNESLIIKVNKDFDEIETEVDNILRTKQIDGILASEDILAIGVLKALASRNISLPTIGFNNSVLAYCATPALTSMDNMLESSCNTVISLLLDVMDGKKAPNRILITGKLVERETFKVLA